MTSKWDKKISRLNFVRSSGWQPTTRTIFVIPPTPTHIMPPVAHLSSEFLTQGGHNQPLSFVSFQPLRLASPALVMYSHALQGLQHQTVFWLLILPLISSLVMVGLFEPFEFCVYRTTSLAYPLKPTLCL